MRTCPFPVLIVAMSVLVGAGNAAAQQVPASESCSTGLLPVQPGGSILHFSCTIVDVPNTGGLPAQTRGTIPNGINDRSQIVGWFTGAGGTRHGFLRTNGQFVTIDVPNADSTEAWGINSRSQMVGLYVVNGQSHGFLLENNHFTTVDPPGATSASAYGINDLGQIVGTYTDGAGGHGFLWTHGRFNTLEIPAMPAAIQPSGINRNGQVVGFYPGSFSGPHSFRLGADGSVTSVVDHPPFEFHFTSGINDRGEMVGQYIDPGSPKGLLVAFGQEWFFGIASANSESAGASGINNRGQIVGHFCSFYGECHGFLLTPPNLVEDVSASASPDGSRVPVVTVIVDNALDTWTLGPGEEILRNGVQPAGAYGSQILWHGGAIYVLGDDYNWWRWTGSTWSFAGSIDPAS